jgi:hypothetical protein
MFPTRIVRAATQSARSSRGVDRVYEAVYNLPDARDGKSWHLRCEARVTAGNGAIASMEASRIDDLARALASTTSRRGALKVLLGGVAGAFGLRMGHGTALAATQTSDCEHFCNQFGPPQKQQCKDTCKSCPGGVSQMCGLTCGCAAPQTCIGAGGSAVCGCVPQPPTIACAGRQCGTITNNCGQPVSCGTCASGQTCSSTGTCLTPTMCDVCASMPGAVPGACGPTGPSMCRCFVDVSGGFQCGEPEIACQPQNVVTCPGQCTSNDECSPGYFCLTLGSIAKCAARCGTDTTKQPC